MSVPRVNCTSTVALPAPFRSSLTDSTFSTPRTCCTAASIGEVRKASVVSGLAPRQLAVTRSRGSSVSGSSSTGIFSQLATPSSASAT
jgi:hypothetical protein